MKKKDKQEHIETPTEEEWEQLEDKYGEATTQGETPTPLDHKKKLLSTKKEILKKDEPYLLLQYRNGRSKWFFGVTTGVFRYEGSDGKAKKIWLSQKFIGTMEWGDDYLKYYNCTEDWPIPHGMNDTQELADTIEKLITKIQLDHEKLKTDEIKARTENVWTIFKGIALIIGVTVGVIAVANILGVDILDKLFGNKPETIVQNVTTTGQVVKDGLINATVR